MSTRPPLNPAGPKQPDAGSLDRPACPPGRATPSALLHELRAVAELHELRAVTELHELRAVTELHELPARLNHQPRAHHSGRCGRSVPSVVSAPWPGCTMVSSANRSNSFVVTS